MFNDHSQPFPRPYQYALVSIPGSTTQPHALKVQNMITHNSCSYHNIIGRHKTTASVNIAVLLIRVVGNEPNLCSEYVGPYNQQRLLRVNSLRSCGNLHWLSRSHRCPLRLGLEVAQLGHQSVVLSLSPLSFSSHLSNPSLSSLQVCLEEHNNSGRGQ